MVRRWARGCAKAMETKGSLVNEGVAEFVRQAECGGCRRVWGTKDEAKDGGLLSGAKEMMPTEMRGGGGKQGEEGLDGKTWTSVSWPCG